jgi:hypothetical protein
MYKKLQTQFFLRNLTNRDLNPSITRKDRLGDKGRQEMIRLGDKGRQEMIIFTCIIAYKESFLFLLIEIENIVILSWPLFAH